MNTSEMEHVLEGHLALVSVAFLPDGNKFMSGSDLTVWIWDIMTGEVTSLSPSETIKLPDGSMVIHIIPGYFQLLTPRERKVSLSWHKDWILTEPPMDG